ncbi:MAG TPA: LPS export ABC transporter periplasmic protein LptC [Gemmatimonadaceae bacterium]|nr:LPS export ABC transporter periplasmic protein LptC [Gemmatimonadaceae bacterium]
MRSVVALAACAVAALAACSRQGAAPPVKSGASMADSAEQVMYNVHSLLTNDGIQRGEMFSDSVYIFDDNTRFELRRVRATFNTATGVKDGTMKGDRGRYNLRQQVLEGFGNVVITTNDGKRLTSPHVRYNQASNEVSSDSAFTMVEPGDTLSGIGFRADPQLTHVTVLKGARGRGSITLPGQ